MSVMMGDTCAGLPSDQFLPGDVVKVLSEREILATLDENGTFEKMPFMPEMLDFCGRTFRVSRQALKRALTILKCAAWITRYSSKKSDVTEAIMADAPARA